MPAHFGNLTIGKATIATFMESFGRPADVHRDSNGTTWIYYENIGPVPGKVEIQANSTTEVIEFISVEPENLSLEDAKRLFGPDFKSIRYAFDTCLSNGEAAPLYESNNGAYEYVVYASLGIALLPEGKRVKNIQYLSKPLGAKESQCNSKQGK